MKKLLQKRFCIYDPFFYFRFPKKILRLFLVGSGISLASRRAGIWLLSMWKKVDTLSQGCGILPDRKSAANCSAASVETMAASNCRA